MWPVDHKEMRVINHLNKGKVLFFQTVKNDKEGDSEAIGIVIPDSAPECRGLVGPGCFTHQRSPGMDYTPASIGMVLSSQCVQQAEDWAKRITLKPWNLTCLPCQVLFLLRACYPFPLSHFSLSGWIDPSFTCPTTYFESIYLVWFHRFRAGEKNSLGWTLPWVSYISDLDVI